MMEMSGMSRANGPTYVGVVKMSVKESEALAKLEMLSQKENADVDVVLTYQRTARDIAAKHKEMFYAAGFQDKRGDRVVMAGVAFTSDIQFGYIPGIWELPETKPVLHLQPMGDGK